MPKYFVTLSYYIHRDGIFQEEVDAESGEEAIDFAIEIAERDERADIEIDSSDAEEIRDDG